jgi:glycosyltransferase involved in cell wall biosynthesis
LAAINNPLVTVIIPVYNCEQFVSKAINSILNQTYSNLEILILNDGSTDGSEAVIKEFSDARIKYISFSANTKKIGIVNHALSVATGELIAFQDADDWSDPSRIARQVNAFSDDSLVLCFTGYSINGKSKTAEHYRTTDALLRNEFHELGFLQPKHYNATVCATMMFRRSVLANEKGYHPWFTGKVGEDIHLVYRIMKHGKAITIPEILYYYHHNRPGSLTHQQIVAFKPEPLYSYIAIAKLIQQDIQNGVNILEDYTAEQLASFELQACKEALVLSYSDAAKQKLMYEQSTSYRIGNLILSPWKGLKKIFRNR